MTSKPIQNNLLMEYDVIKVRETAKNEGIKMPYVHQFIFLSIFQQRLRLPACREKYDVM